MSIDTKADFDNLIDRIQDLVKKYENNVLHCNQYQIYLANGERISFEVSPWSIAHLLGIRLDYIKSTNLFKNTDAYLLLKEFLENSYSVYRYVQEGRLSYSSLFSNFIEQKLTTFEKVIYYFDPNDIEFICKYDKGRTYQLGLEKNYFCDYFIAKTDPEGNLYLLGLIRNGTSYMPMTNLYFPKDDKQFTNLKGLLMNQLITYANNVVISNLVTEHKSNRFLHISLKLRKLDTLKRYASSMKGLTIDTAYDLQFILKGLAMKDSKINAYKMVCQQFMKKIKDHEIFSLEQLEEPTKEQLGSEIVSMLETYNDEICNVDNSKAQKTYSNLLGQYKNLEEQVFTLQQQLDRTKQEANSYYEQLQVLEQENVSYQEFQEEILSVVERKRVKKEENETE